MLTENLKTEFLKHIETVILGGCLVNAVTVKPWNITQGTILAIPVLRKVEIFKIHENRIHQKYFQVIYLIFHYR